MIGVHPDSFTLRQLMDMAESVVRVSWSQTSFLAAYTHNSGINCSKRVQPSDINPYAGHKRKQRIRGKEGFRESMRAVVF